MTTLREQLEAWASAKFHDERHALAMLELLWPVIEAAERIAKEYDDDWVYGVAAKALEQLNEKLKEET